jgi:hypothetical protein
MQGNESQFSAKQVRDFIPAGLLSAGRNVRILRQFACAALSAGTSSKER